MLTNEARPVAEDSRNASLPHSQAPLAHQRAASVTIQVLLDQPYQIANGLKKN